MIDHCIFDCLLNLAVLLLCLVCRPSSTSSAMTATAQVPAAAVMRMHVFRAAHAQHEYHLVDVDQHWQWSYPYVSLSLALVRMLPKGWCVITSSRLCPLVGAVQSRRGCCSGVICQRSSTCGLRHLQEPTQARQRRASAARYAAHSTCMHGAAAQHFRHMLQTVTAVIPTVCCFALLYVMCMYVL
jgi:hypothetical protein